MVPTDTIGSRIRYWRLRRGGMTQGVLAGLAGVDQSFISKVEAGLRGVERRSTLVAIAKALQVSVADLLGQPGDPTDPLKSEAAAVVPAIRAAIIEVEEGERRPPTMSADELAELVERVDGMRAVSDYGGMAPLLPAFLLDAAAHGGVALIRAAYETSVCLRNLGYRDLALPAARIAVTAAQEAEHTAWLGAARFVHTLAMPIETAGTTSRIAERSLSELQAGAADVAVRQMLGQMHLSASMACAVDGRAADAQAHITEARREAATLGDPEDGAGFNLCSFGPTNLSLWRMNVAIELGEYGEVLELARNTTPAPLRVANRHQTYWMSYGRALAHSGKTDREALAAFMHAERAAPLAFSLNPMARDTVASMVRRARRRSVSEDLRIMARRLGVDVDA
ncbi:helix-turn-helix domain-containing protein [Micromonospora sp. CPCC 205371]|nr:helix-turn-helix domain-containing protein [Micromonospora sp. CPCC 205371]